MTKTGVVWGLLLALALPAIAHADDVADEAEFRFRRGAELYAKRDFQGALGEFFTSNRLVHNRNVVFNIARTLEQLGRAEEAYRYYAGLADEDLSPADRKEVDTSLQRLSARVALVRVESEPPGATIYVDRKDLGGHGQTPRTLALPAQPAKILLELAGHYPQQRDVKPAIGKLVTVRVPLETIYGHLALTVAPPEAEVRLDREDGEKLGPTAQVVPGRHVLWVSASGFVTQTLTIDVPEEKTVAVTATLVPRPPPTGALVVRANVDGALIVVDGKESGFTPGVVEGVVAGAHRVDIESEGRETFSQQVTIAANERAFVDAHLRYAGPSVEAATKSLARASDAPGSITVLTREELRAFGYQTLAEALQSVRGVFVSDDRTYSTLGFRGVAPLGDFNNRILILVDGHTVYDPWVDQGYVGRELDTDLEDVERIEVVRGGGSALYGTGAIFGVINVVHRQPDEGAHADLFAGTGTLGENQGRATGSIGHGRYGALVTAGAYGASGEPVYVSPEPEFGAAGVAQTLSTASDAEHAFHAALRVRAGDLSLLADYNNRLKDSPVGQYGAIFGSAMRSDDAIGFGEARYEHAFDSGLSVSARAYYDGSRFHETVPVFRDDGVTPTVSVDRGGADAAGAELRLQLPELARNRLSVGAEGQDRWRVFESSVTDGAYALDDTHSEQIASAYANDEIRLVPQLTLVVGARLDDHIDSFGLVFAPRAAVVGHFYEGATTKLMVSRSFRAPSIYERFYADGITQVAAPKLEPELSEGAELEHTHPLSDETTLTGAVFYTQLEQLIDLETIAAGSNAGLLQYQNVPGRVRSYGVEAEVRYRPGPALLLEGYYAYQHTRLDDGSQLDNSPGQTAAARAMVPVMPDVLTLGSEVVYNSARLAPPDDAGERQLVGEELVWNATVSGVYPRYRLRYQASVFNLLDQRVELPAAGMPPGVNVAQRGRTLRMTLGVTF